MFDLLKKKISAFTDKIKEALEKKEKEAETKQETAQEQKTETKQIESKTEQLIEKTPAETSEEKLANHFDETSSKIPAKIPKPAAEVKHQIEEPRELETEEEQIAEQPIKQPEEERKIEAKIGLKTKLKSLFSKEIKIEENDLKNFLEEFELALLESDVETNTAETIVNGMKKELIGKSIPKKIDLSVFLRSEVKTVLSNTIQIKKQKFFELIEQKKPFIILFIGPNGAGKTTTIAKLSHLLQSKNKKIIWAAADTFRAASIEQLEKHGEKLNIRVIKHSYGADPCAVAFDAIKAAEASKSDIVMIDSAGRQETNKNLVNELKKMERVIKPDLKIFIGEAIAGKSLLQMAREFDKEIGIDAFILTKIDADAKGGTAISLLHNLQKPILFLGTGQNYNDLIEFEPNYILDRIIPN